MKETERPTMTEINCLSRILLKAKHRNVADAALKGFMWAVWPTWYERNKWEFYQSEEKKTCRGRSNVSQDS